MSSPTLKICIADDEPRGRQLLRDLLSPEGYQLVEAVDGEEAVAVVLLERPDLVLLDVMMPHLNGFEVCRKLRADKGMSQVPIILLTALDDRRSRLQGLEAGADDFISKPLDAMELRTRVRTITRLNRFRTLFDERERFASALALSPDAIVIVAPDGKIHFTNDAYGRLVDPTCCRSAETRNFYDALPPAMLTEFLALAECVLAGATVSHPFETTLAAPQRDATVVEITLGRLPWTNGPALQFILRDITEKKLLETQLLRSQRIEVLGQLAGGIVHDVNNLLTAILGSAQLIQMGGHTRTPELLQAIDSSAKRGVNLLRQLLLFARGSDEALQEVRPSVLLAEVASVVRETFPRNIALELLADESCPVISADPNQLHQILMNLCVNARDAMPASGTLTLSVVRRSLDASQAKRLGGEAHAGEFVVFAVRDSGSGILPQVKAKLFDPFFTTKLPGQGTGLGLATVLRLVRRHEGFIHLETEVGIGTCFHCFLPLTASVANAA